MPRFPQFDQLGLPATLLRYIPGKPHPDGRRYLPLLIFRLTNGFELAITDRHHVVAEEEVGMSGTISVVSSLSKISVQPADQTRQGLVDHTSGAGRATTAPAIYGQVVSIPAWESEREHLPYEYLYTELLLDVGLGVMGVRTAMTADDMAGVIGKVQLVAGDWITVGPSRIDILAFKPDTIAASTGAAYEKA